jgi:hypothetical protein
LLRVEERSGLVGMVLEVGIVGTIVLKVLLLSVVFEFIRHWRQGYSFRKIRQRVNQSSLFILVMVERASITELALSMLKPVLARLSLIIGMDSSQSSFAKSRRKWLIFLPKFFLSMSELTEVLERTDSTLEIVSAHFGLEFPLEIDESVLIAEEVLIDLLLGQLLNHFGWRVVEIAFAVLLLALI